MSVTEQLGELAPLGYPASGVAPEGDPAQNEPFGPGGNTSLTAAARPVAMYGFLTAAVRPTETQAASAETRAHGVVEERGHPAAPSLDAGPFPALTPEQIAADRVGKEGRFRPTTQAAPVTQGSQRSPVERPEPSAAPHEPAQATAELPRGEYPSTRVRAARSSREMLRSIIRPDAAPTAPLRVVDRLTATPFHNLRRFKDNSDRQARRTLNFTLRLAETMFHYGADALDVENAIIAVCATYGVESLEVDITNQSVTINYVNETTDTGHTAAVHRDGAAGGSTAAAHTGQNMLDDPTTSSHTVMRVVRSWTDNYAGLANSHQLVTRIIEGDMPLRDAEKELAAINSRPKPYPKWAVWVATIAAAAALTVGIGGGVAGALVAAVSALVVQLVSVKLGAWRIPEFFALAAKTLIVTLMALVISAVGVDLSPSRVIAGGIIMLLPTTRMVSTMQDAINGFPVTAAGRLLSTAMAFLGIIAGISVGTAVSGYLGVPRIDVSQSSFSPADPVTNTAFMLIATVLIAVTMQAKPRHLLPTAVSALTGMLVYHGSGHLGLGTRLDIALGAITSGCAAALLAARCRIPQTILAIPAMVFLLPGLSIFRGMYAITIEGETTGAGVIGLVNAMASILILASGVVLSNYLMRPFSERMHTLTSRRNRRR